jgi:N-acyl-D-amino-acid deacylase
MKKKADIFIKDGLVYDGTVSEPFIADIAISGDRISAISTFETYDAGLFIDAEGLAVSPGFIDAHAHSDFTILSDPRAEGKVCQGITTEINGNCGMSAAPLYGQVRERREEDLREFKIKERWNTLSEYFDLLVFRGAAINVATLAGHGNIRGSVVGYDDRRPSADEMNEMKIMLGEALKEGAIGLSTGLIYPPGIYADTYELLELCREVPDNLFIYTSHMRNEGDLLVEAVNEIIRIGQAGKRVHISHIKTAGEENWRKADEVISMLHKSIESGVRITCDRYPYIASSTDLDSILPPWVFEGGNEEQLRRLSDGNVLERIKRELSERITTAEYWDRVMVSSVASESNRWMEGKTITVISRQYGISEIDAFLKILTEERLRVAAIFFMMSEDNLRRFLALPFCMIGSDSSARCFDGPTKAGTPHPRGFGTFARFIGRYAREEKIMRLSQAIHKATMLPAKTFGIKGRGQLKAGMYADIVIFDPGTFCDRATYTDPFQKPEGMHYVLVNGVPVIKEGEFTGKLPGRVLKSGY